MTHGIRWTIEKIGQRLSLIEPLVYRRRAPMPPFRYHALPSPDAAPIIEPTEGEGWTTIQPNTYWGTWVTDFMLQGEFAIPADWSRDAAIALFLPVGDAGEFSHPETLIYVDGVAYATCDRNHEEVLLRTDWHDGKAHQLALHGWTGNGGFLGAESGTKLLMRQCEVVQLDQPTRDFTITARVALGIARKLDDNAPARGHLLNALDAAFKVLDTREPFGDRFYDSVTAAHETLRTGIEAAGPPLDVDVVATGHAHIDVAWLWTLSQTRRKAGRTFHTVLRLMEQFPDYHFTQSQPQLYEYIRQDYPELFEAIKARIAEGRWETTGDMWVEADCNLSGAESLARQFLLGRSFFREHFGKGKQTGVLWLPDVFGYAWALPQLIKHADLDYFFTIKIGWSQYNRLPYDSFWWQGVDGTRVLTHFSPTPEAGSAFASTYNAKAGPEDVLGTWTNFRQKDLSGGNGASPIPPLLMAFGYGDGGGGPTREMLENLREMQAFPATPQVRQSSVGEFFAQLEESAGDRLPTWNGELYLEYHRGTYTTQSRNKRANRRSEFLLHDAEFLASLASVLNAGYQYPSETFRDAWRLICLNQFHDIIPGSSVNAVYVDSAVQYEQITEMGTTARDEALAAVAGAVGGDVIIINPTSFGRSDLAFLPADDAANVSLLFADGDTVRTQPTDGGVWIDTGTIQPYSALSLKTGTGAGARSEGGPTASPTLLENDYVRVELNAEGDITRIYDKAAAREVLAQGAVANQFQAFEDRPKFWDAWDVDIFFDDKLWLADPATEVRVVEQGALRATLEVTRRILNSTYVQRISLAYNSPRLDIETTIQWQERHVMLKVAFPVDILSPTATYDIQWGNVPRPTHRNTSWDWARFETCAQKWVDLSEGDYGVSVLNDCKYGHDIQGNVIRISLLRAPTHPDPEADQGEHTFTYSILPHTGGWNETTIGASYALNDALIVHDARGTTTDAKDGWTAPFVAFDQPNIVIETIKRAEDGNGIIVRGYESQRRRGPVTLKAGFGIASATHTNLLEEDADALDVQDNTATFTVRPYQIFTLRLVPS